jgi:hypothetical protein
MPQSPLQRGKVVDVEADRELEERVGVRSLSLHVRVAEEAAAVLLPRWWVLQRGVDALCPEDAEQQCDGDKQREHAALVLEMKAG